ncbi:hypothetical protein BV20DRAFT_960697 [Pilatotrama ljubarskyi]|nr:hypothetical protein BV20DRAFT_960697 [Pilatotrama ljubarskyi]
MSPGSSILARLVYSDSGTARHSETSATWHTGGTGCFGSHRDDGSLPHEATVSNRSSAATAPCPKRAS